MTRTNSPETVDHLHRELVRLDAEAMKRRVWQMADAGCGEATISEYLRLRLDYVRRTLSERPR